MLLCPSKNSCTTLGCTPWLNRYVAAVCRSSREFQHVRQAGRHKRPVLGVCDIADIQESARSRAEDQSLIAPRFTGDLPSKRLTLLVDS